jgi:PGF-CTERM protein
MELRRTVVPVVAALVLVTSPAVGAAVGGAEAGRASTGEFGDRAVESVPVAQASVEPVSVQPDRLASTQTVDPDTVLLRADVAANGTAHWRIEYLVRLDDRNTTDAFESVAADIREDPTPFTDQFTDRMRRTVRAAENATGREMAVTDASIAFRTEGDTGVVEQSVTWTGLAAVEGDRLVVTEPFASGFEPDRQFRVTAPDGYDLDATPTPDGTSDGAATWDAGTSLDGFEVTASSPETPMATATPPGGGTATDGDTATDGGTTAGSGPGFGAALAVLALLSLAALVAREQ